MKKLLGNRKFQLWEYSVSHGKLLIRSPKNEQEIKNIDIKFIGVDYISLPRHLREICLVEPTDDEVLRFENILNKPLLKRNIHIIESADTRHVVIAAGMKIEENLLDIFESPL